MRHLAIAVLSAALLLAWTQRAAHCAAAPEPEPDFENPVRSSVDDEVKNLPGLNDAIDFRQYSGYLQADQSGKKFFFYWFVESQNDSANDPVLLWLNGGPGCSSLGGLLTELGPYRINDDGKTLALNEFSWNKYANVLFLESPAGVGFSYSNSLINIHTDDSTARANHAALKSFFKKFPQYQNNSLYLSGESYAGVYLPTLGVLADADPELNLRGVAIGNGFLDAAKLADSLIFFAYHHGIVGKSAWERVSQHCCAGKPPARESCQMSGRNSTYACINLIRELTEQVMNFGINPYNLYGKCAHQSASVSRQIYQNALGASRPHISRDQVDKRLLELALNPDTHMKDRPFSVLRPQSAALGANIPCIDEHLMVHYLNQPDVRNALHVPERVPAWDTCAAIAYVIKYPKLVGGLSPQMKSLISSKRRLALMVYNGDVDMVCNFLGDEWFVDDLGRKVVADYQSWHVGKQVAGYVKHFDGITYATIRGAGHMVPGDRSREAFAMMKNFLQARGPHVEL